MFNIYELLDRKDWFELQEHLRNITCSSCAELLVQLAY